MAHIRQGYRESVVDATIAMEFENAGVRRRPLFLFAVMGLFFGIFGFNTAAYLVAGTYTRLFGSAQTHQFTVTSSAWNNRRKYGRCYDTRFSEQASLFQVWRGLCLHGHAKVGGTVLVSGYSTWLGIYVEGVRQEVTGNELL